MFSMITALIPLIATVGKWLIDRNMMSIEAQKNFLRWVDQSSKDGAISARLRSKYDDLIKQHLAEDKKP